MNQWHVLALLILYLKNSFSQEVDTCILQDGTPGICVNINFCEEAKIDPSNTRICSFSGNTPIVCCVIGSPSKRFCNRVTANAVQSRFPYMAAIAYTVSNSNQQLYCGGALISDRFVITSANCVRPNKDIKFVRLGSSQLYSNDAKIYQVIERYMHPKYNLPQIYNDIGLLKLETVVLFTDLIKPACLFTEEIPQWLNIVATGWRSLGQSERQANDLEVLDDIDEYKNCSRCYSKYPGYLEHGIDESIICAARSRQVNYEVTSGSPLIFYQDGKYQLLGIKFFQRDCKAGTPLFTKISYYIDWIESIVWP